MKRPSALLEEAAALRNKAARALRLAVGLQKPDHTRLTQFGEELRVQAAELERQAAAEAPSRPAEPGSDRAESQNSQKQKKQRGGSNDPDPQV